MIAKDHTARSGRDAILEDGSHQGPLPPNQHRAPSAPHPHSPGAPNFKAAREAVKGRVSTFPSPAERGDTRGPRSLARAREDLGSRPRGYREEGVCERVSPSSKATHGGGWRSFGAGGGAGTGSAASGPGRRPRRRALPRPPRPTPGAGRSHWVSDPGQRGPDTRLFWGAMGGECCLRTGLAGLSA